MPIYDFKNKNTGEVVTHMMSYDDKVKFLEDNPDYMSVILSAPAVGYDTGGILKKAGDGWKEVQDKIKSGQPKRYQDNIKTK